MNSKYLFAVMVAVCLQGCDLFGGGGGGGSDAPPASVETEDRPAESELVETEPETTTEDPEVVDEPADEPEDTGGSTTEEEVVEVDPMKGCLVLTWELPTERTDGSALDPAEIDYIIVVREKTDAQSSYEAQAAMHDRGNLNERIESGDPLVTMLPYDVTKATCEDIGIEPQDNNYWMAVAVADYESVLSNLSEAVHHELNPGVAR